MSNLPRALRLALAVTLLVVGLVRLAPRAVPAAAVVTHGAGFQASVDGFTSWYGSYQVGGLGVAWCIDHGIRAPDPDLGYVPTGLESVPEGRRVSLAWAMGRYGTNPDAVGAAALMLVAHDLMGATYPSGRLDVDALGTGSLTGFGGAEADVLARARAIKADALGHGGLRPPWRIDLTSTRPFPGSPGVATVLVTAAGTPVAGITVAFDADPVAVSGPSSLTTGSDGNATFWYDPPTTPFRLSATATVPDLVVQAFAPTAAAAQRVARPATVPLAAALDLDAPSGPPRPTTTTTSTTRPPVVTTTIRPPATTTTTRPPTTTTSTTRPPVVTSTTRPPVVTTTTQPPATTSTTGPTATTTTTRPPASTTTTVGPATSTTTPTTTSTTAPPATTTTTTPPPPPPPSPPTSAPPTTPPTTPPNTPSPAPPSLPRTGFDPVSLGATGSGLVLLGSALRGRPGRRRRRTQRRDPAGLA